MNLFCILIDEDCPIFMCCMLRKRAIKIYSMSPISAIESEPSFSFPSLSSLFHSCFVCAKNSRRCRLRIMHIVVVMTVVKSYKCFVRKTSTFTMSKRSGPLLRFLLPGTTCLVECEWLFLILKNSQRSMS